MTGSHRAMRFGSLLAVTLCVGATAVSSPAAAAAKEASPNQVLVTAAAAAARAGSVRVAAQFVSQGEVGNVVVDSAANAGQEALEIGKQLVSIVLVDGAVYISGNSQGLISYFGLPSSAAKTLSGRWISFNSSDTGYQTLVADVTLSSVLKGATPTGTLVRGRSTVLSGTPVVSIAGKGPAGEAKMVLFLAQKGSGLPVEAAITNGTGKHTAGEIIKFSRWGERVAPDVPTGAIPVSTLRSESATAG